MVLEAAGAFGCNRSCDAGSDGDRRDFKYFDSDASRSPGSDVADKGKQRTGAVIKGFCVTNTCIAPGI